MRGRSISWKAWLPCAMRVGSDVYEREAFVSFPDRAFVVRLRAHGAARLNLPVALGSPHPTEETEETRALRGWREGRPRTSSPTTGPKSQTWSTSRDLACVLPLVSP